VRLQGVREDQLAIGRMVSVAQCPTHTMEVREAAASVLLGIGWQWEVLRLFYIAARKEKQGGECKLALLNKTS
jgi:hypothetical protein